MSEIENYSPFLTRQIQHAWKHEKGYTLAMMLSLAASAVLETHSEVWEELNFLQGVVNNMDWE